MNLTLLSRALCQPWAIRPLELSALTQLILSTDARSSTRATERPKHAKVSAGKSASISSTATIIPVWGVLGRGWDDVEKYWLNAVDVDDLMQDIDATPAGSTIVLWFRSPGGIITGIPEMAAYLRNAVKSRTVIAFCDDLCASAAYWLASQCSLIVTTPTADIGSIGVYIAFYDFTEFLSKQGISLELFKAGRLKAMGVPGNPLSDEESAHLQACVDESYEQFTADVLRNREIDPEMMQGQTFRGKAAYDGNLADVQVAGYAAFMSALARGKLTV